jgi:hypothetical protein
MNAKLTLTLDSKVIQKAKKYAVEKRSSVMELKGILGKAPNDFDYREERYRYLMEKHK